MRNLHLLAAALAVTAVSACETVQGAGRDMQTASQMVSQYYNGQGYGQDPGQPGYGQPYQQPGQPMVQDPFANQPAPVPTY